MSAEDGLYFSGPQQISVAGAGKEIIRIRPDGSFKVSEDATLEELHTALNRYMSAKGRPCKINGVETVPGSMHMLRTNYSDN